MEMKDYLRSSRETMLGWVHLPRYIDKIRMHLRGELTADYQPNLGKGFDGMWLEAAGLTHEAVVEQVRQSVTDGQVAEWLRKQIKTEPEAIAAFNTRVLTSPDPANAAGVARLEMRKSENGLGHRADVRTFVDFNDADEGRF